MSQYVKSLSLRYLAPGRLTYVRRPGSFRAAILLSVLSACGGGGGGSASPPPVTVAPADLRYPTAPAFVVGTAITPLTPTVIGTVTSYNVSPELPAGLSLNTSRCHLRHPDQRCGNGYLYYQGEQRLR